MNSQDIAHLISAPEGARLERTERMDFAGFEKKLCKALCAFANDVSDTKTSAYFVIGAKDEKEGGGLSGYRFSDADEQRLSNLIRDGLVRPELNVTIDKCLDTAGDVIVLTVQTSAIAPHRYDKRIWVRLGASTREATVDEENRLHDARRYRTGLTFDTQGVDAASLDDLDLEAFYGFRASVVAPETIEANHRPLPAQLAALNFYDSTTQHPTVAGLVCFGKAQAGGYRKGLAGGAGLVQFWRIAGTTLVDPELAFEEICTNMYATREKLDALMQAHIHKRSVVQGSELQFVPSYPYLALRELVYNAIAHRDYSLGAPVQIKWFDDRIEMTNPGQLFPPMTLDKLAQGDTSTQRNPVVLGVLRELRMVERRGSGIAKVQQWLRANGNPPARFENFSGPLFKVTVFARA